MKAVRVTEPIVLDGLGNDAVWRSATVYDRFGEREPSFRAEPALRTAVQFAYDEQALFVLVTCQTDSKGITVRTLRRDSFGIYEDDMVLLKIDPSYSRRTSMNFGVNTDGAQVDALTLEDGRVFLQQWDAVWQSEVSRSESGFTVEFRIPFSVLGLAKASELVMGFNVSRFLVHPLAKYDLRLSNPPERYNAASSFAVLDGFRDLDPGLAVELTPYVLARTRLQREFVLDPRESPTLAVGGDFRMQTAPASYVEGTVLTDFAQVQMDAAQVARDRFPLFFPEQRPFFINGLGILNFGVSGSAQLFNSRRIGLEDGSPVPLVAGVKAYGQTGDLRYAALNVQTLNRPATDDGEALGAENFSIGRLRYSMTDDSWIGALAVAKHRLGESGHENWALGLDAESRHDRGRLVAYGFAGSTYSESPAEAAEMDASTGEISEPAVAPSSTRGNTGYLSLQHKTVYLKPRIQWLYSDENFDPRLGFYKRPGTAQTTLSVTAMPRPKFLGLRQIDTGPSLTTVSNSAHTEILTQSTGVNTKAIWRNTSIAEYEYRRVLDRVQSDFTLFGMSVGAARYVGHRHRFKLSSPRRQAVIVGGEYRNDEMFGGRTHSAKFDLTFRPLKHIALKGSYTQLFGHLDDAGEDFNFGFMNSTVELAFNRFVVWDTVTRFTMQPESESLGIQSRLRWRYVPGSDVYLVYRTDHDLSEGPDPAFHEVTLKATYYLRHIIGD